MLIWCYGWHQNCWVHPWLQSKSSPTSGRIVEHTALWKLACWENTRAVIQEPNHSCWDTRSQHGELQAPCRPRTTDLQRREEPAENYVRKERMHGYFSRTLALWLKVKLQRHSFGKSLFFRPKNCSCCKQMINFDWSRFCINLSITLLCYHRQCNIRQCHPCKGECSRSIIIY